MGFALAKAEGGAFTPLPDAHVINIDRFPLTVLEPIIVIKDFAKKAVSHENRSFL